MLTNIRFLKWALYYNIYSTWYILHGIPGETEKDYRQQEELISKITHLEPPKAFRRLFLQRFSPMHDFFENEPNSWKYPRKEYKYIYPEHVNLEDICMEYDYFLETTIPDDRLTGLKETVENWIKSFYNENTRDTLSYCWRGHDMEIVDMRGNEPYTRYMFRDASPYVYESISDTMRNPDEIAEYLRNWFNLNLSEKEIRAELSDFTELGLALHENDKFFGLALPARQSVIKPR